MGTERRAKRDLEIVASPEKVSDDGRISFARRNTDASKIAEPRDLSRLENPGSRALRASDDDKSIGGSTAR